MLAAVDPRVDFVTFFHEGRRCSVGKIRAPERLNVFSECRPVGTHRDRRFTSESEKAEASKLEKALLSRKVRSPQETADFRPFETV